MIYIKNAKYGIKMLKIISISLITIFLTLTIKQKSPEFSSLISVCGSVLVLLLIFDYVVEVIDYFMLFSNQVGVENDIIKIALKIISVSFLTEFVSDLAIDFGNTAIATKLIFGGRVVICLIMLPVLKDLFALLSSFY